MKKIYQYFILIALAFSCSNAIAQIAVTGIINGKISANDGKPAPFVSIQIVENSKKTISDEDGSFTFNNLEDGEYTLKTSYVGLQIQTQKVSVISGKASDVRFTLSENSAQLDERSEEHTSELQSRENLVCRLLLEKKNNTSKRNK